jgi:hypothetical protein
MPTDKTKNILKGFGEGANVILQESMSRSARPTGAYDISDGEPVEITTTAGNTPASVANPLGRTPIGAFVINCPDDVAREFAVRVTDNEIWLTHDITPGTFTVWVF